MRDTVKQRHALRLWTLLALGTACMAVFMAGCSSDQMPEGVVATVNGQPLHYARLEAKYDLQHMGWGPSLTSSVSKLKNEYGAMLADMIVLELVHQALARENIPVTSEEVQAAEDVVRQDYPEGAFEEVLVEEYIDLELWRQELKDRLALEKFLQEIIRPQITLNYQEAEAYYKEHISDFFLPSRLRFLLITGPNRELTAKALAHYLESRDADAVSQRFSQVKTREMKMSEDRLPANWIEPLKELQQGEASDPQPTQNGFEALVLQERLDARVLDPSSAYPLVEKVLLDKKMEQAFNAWLEQTVHTAEIKVSEYLLASTPEATAIDEGPEAADHSLEEGLENELEPEPPQDNATAPAS